MAGYDFEGEREDARMLMDIGDDGAGMREKLEQIEKKQKAFKASQLLFIQMISKRLYDKNSFVRGKALKQLTRVIRCPEVKIGENEIEFYKELFSETIPRLRDQTAQVRKQALKLFSQLVSKFSLYFRGAQIGGDQWNFESIENIDQAKQDYLDVKEQYEKVLPKVAEKLRLNISDLKLRIAHKNDLSADQLSKMDGPQRELVALYTNVKDCQVIHQLHEHQRDIMGTIDEAVEYLIQVLASKTQQDVIETIIVLTRLHRFGIPSTKQALQRMFPLIFSKDPKIVEMVVQSINALYLKSYNANVEDEDSVAPKNLLIQQPVVSDRQRARNLLKLMRESSIVEITCIEEYLKRAREDKELKLEMLYQELWVILKDSKIELKDISKQIFKKELVKVEQDTEINQIKVRLINDTIRYCLQLIRMLGSGTDSELLYNSRDDIYEVAEAMQVDINPDFMQLKETLIMFGVIVKQKAARKKKDLEILQSLPQQRRDLIAANKEKVRLLDQLDQDYMNTVLKIIENHFGCENLDWFSAAEAYLNTILELKAKHVPSLVRNFLNSLTKRLFVPGSLPNSGVLKTKPEDVTDFHYAHTLFAVGHIAIKMLIYFDELEEMIKQFIGNDKGKYQIGDGNNAESAQDELENICGGKQADIDFHTTHLNKIREEKFVQKGIIMYYLPLLLQISKSALSPDSPPSLLQRTAILALCKVLCVSSLLCKEHIALVFQLLEAPTLDAVTKANIVVALGDLYQKHANVVEEHIKRLYRQLHPPTDLIVRKQALLVIVHLILNGMLKLRGEIVDIVMLLLDPDEHVRNQVNLFLAEQNLKDGNVIYNLFQNAIHRLSREFKLGRGEYERVIECVFRHINEEKKKAMETLLESLANKIVRSDCHEERMNSVFCLSLMSINTEAGIEKLLEYADAIRERLQESPELKQYLIDKLMTKFAMFILNKPELKQPIEDLRFRLLGNDLEYAQLGLLSASQPKLAKSASKKSAPAKKAGEDQVMRDEASRKRGREEISREGAVLNFDASLGQAAGRPIMQAKRGATGPPNKR